MHITHAGDLALLHNLLNAEISRAIAKQRGVNIDAAYKKLDEHIKRLTTLNEKVQAALVTALQAETLKTLPTTVEQPEMTYATHKGYMRKPMPVRPK